MKIIIIRRIYAFRDIDNNVSLHWTKSSAKFRGEDYLFDITYRTWLKNKMPEIEIEEFIPVSFCLSEIFE